MHSEKHSCETETVDMFCKYEMSPLFCRLVFSYVFEVYELIFVIKM